MDIKNIYYFFMRIYFKNKLKEIGEKVNLRISSRFINGKYITIEDNVTFSENLIIAIYPTYAEMDNPVKSNGKGVRIAQGVRGNRNITIYCAESVYIGCNCLLGSNILISDNNHGIIVDPQIPYYNQPLKTKETIIEEGCWIGQNVSILAGSIIGKYCIIGANSIVCGEIPPYSIAVGNPARVIKKWDFELKEWVKVIDNH